MRYPELLYKDYSFFRKECVQCSTTFWNTDSSVKYCGSRQCNQFNRYNQVKDVVKTPGFLWGSFCSYFKNNLSENYVKAHVLRRALTINKYHPSESSYSCAGVSCFQKMIVNNSLKEKYSKNLFINNQFCYRFYDKENVEHTMRHSTGFFMMGLHCFESLKDRFTTTWKQEILTKIIGFFIQVLQWPLDKLYFHADTWSDGIRGGSCIEFFIDGLEVGNMVFIDRDMIKGQDLETNFLDVGLGLERISKIFTKKHSYFENVIEDHLRTLIVSITDKVYPSKIGVGYNIRKIIENLFKMKNFFIEDKKFIKEKLQIIINDLNEICGRHDFSKDVVDEILLILDDQFKRCKASQIV